MRLTLSCTLLAATSALCGCSSPSIPSWAVAGHKGHYLVEKRTAQRSHHKTIYVAPAAARPNATREGSHIGDPPSEAGYFETGSEAWQRAQQIEQQKFDSLLAICRGC